jgi:Concanavalin A-like lectin/glucanases superfamily
VAIINAARQAVPAVDYALGVAGVAAAGAIIGGLLGYTRVSIIVLGGILVAMILLFAFARLVAAQSASVTLAGVVLLWAVIIFFVCFLVFTVTAVAAQVPLAWAKIIGVADNVETILEPKSKPILSWSGDTLPTNGTNPAAKGNVTVKNNPDTARKVLEFHDGGYLMIETDHLPYGNSARTLELWFRLETRPENEAFFAGYGEFCPSGGAFELGAHNTGLGSTHAFFSNWDDYVSPPRDLETHRWYHLAVTADDHNGCTVFLNGESAQRDCVLKTPRNGKLYLGALDPALTCRDPTFVRALEGELRDIRIYDQALTAPEVRWLYQKDRPTVLSEKPKS